MSNGTPTDSEAYAEFRRHHPPAFLFPLGHPPVVPDRLRAEPAEREPPLGERLRLLAQDRCVLFFHAPTPGPVDWYASPLTGGVGVADRTWCDVPDFSPAQRDVRAMWEPARAAWAIDLARAVAHGHHELDVAGLYWRWVDSWARACPPWLGTQWKCGQEAAVRMIALGLGLWSLADDPATTPHRWVQFARIAWATGYRIYHHIDYAVSQNNNHALSEACGLLLVSGLFPELRDAQRWRETGRRVLARGVRQQVYTDGSYVQHSLNYHRVMLDVCTLALRLAEVVDEPFDQDVYEPVGKAAEFLFQMTDPGTGRAPNYGNNDGAWVLPLCECTVEDFRPAVQAAHYLVNRERLLPEGPWDESLLWLFGEEALAAHRGPERAPESSAFPVGGYYTLRRGESWALVRCHDYRDRPGQHDMLHLDLWWRGRNVLRDCGTYLYYVPQREDLTAYFKSLAAHNVIEIDGVEPYERVSRFLTFPWPRARLRLFDAETDAPLRFEGELHDYDRAPWRVLLRRSVISPAAGLWLVVDDLLGTGQHGFTLRWHLLDAPASIVPEQRALRLDHPDGPVSLATRAEPEADLRLELVRGREDMDAVQGYAATRYAHREPIPVAELRGAAHLPVRLVTAVALDAPTVAVAHVRGDATEDLWDIATPRGTGLLTLSRPERGAERMLLSWSELRA